MAIHHRQQSYSLADLSSQKFSAWPAELFGVPALALLLKAAGGYMLGAVV